MLLLCYKTFSSLLSPLLQLSLLLLPLWPACHRRKVDAVWICAVCRILFVFTESSEPIYSSARSSARFSGENPRQIALLPNSLRVWAFELCVPLNAQLPQCGAADSDVDRPSIVKRIKQRANRRNSLSVLGSTGITALGCIGLLNTIRRRSLFTVVFGWRIKELRSGINDRLNIRTRWNFC